MKLREILNGHVAAEITCAFTGARVRHLVVIGDRVDILAADGDAVGVGLDDEVIYQPWFMDRGSLLMRGDGGQLFKLCTEGDGIFFPDTGARGFVDGSGYASR